MDLAQLPLTDAQGDLRVVVETPAGSRVKLAWDPSTATFRWSRALPAGLTYPYDWGFFPSTMAEDGDPVDAMIIGEGPTPPGVQLSCRPIGILRVQQREGRSRAQERNDRLFVVPLATIRYQDLKDIRDIGRPTLQDLEDFFVQSQRHTAKHLRLVGWEGPAAARAAVQAARPR